MLIQTFCRYTGGVVGGVAGVLLFVALLTFLAKRRGRPTYDYQPAMDEAPVSYPHSMASNSQRASMLDPFAPRPEP